MVGLTRPLKTRIYSKESKGYLNCISRIFSAVSLGPSVMLKSNREISIMVTLTPNAVKQIKQLQQDPSAQGCGLRVAVIGGGCSGMSYKLDFQKEPTGEDKVFEQDGVRIFVDPKSYLYLKGLEMHYEGGLNGTGFQFRNPNAQKSCGCGTSFSV